MPGGKDANEHSEHSGAETTPVTQGSQPPHRITLFGPSTEAQAVCCFAAAAACYGAHFVFQAGLQLQGLSSQQASYQALLCAVVVAVIVLGIGFMPAWMEPLLQRNEAASLVESDSDIEVGSHSTKICP